MDLVIPIRPGHRSGPEPVKWLLRTYYQHWPAIERVFIVGYLPPCLDATTLIHIPTTQASTKFVNIGENLQAAIDSPDLGEEWIWANDDMFLITDYLDPLPLYRRPQPYADVIDGWGATGAPDHREYVIGMRRQYEILKDWGHENPHCCELHVPIPINRTHLEAVTRRAWSEYPDLERGHFRGIYGGTLPIGDTVPLDDVKIRAHNRPPAQISPWVSTSPVSWNVGAVGRWIRERYWRPSRWELR